MAGSFVSRIAGANTNSAGENIAAGTKTWADTLRVWKASPGHNENLLLADGDIIGVAVAHNDTTRFKTYWAMVIGHRREGGKTRTASGRLKLFPADNDSRAAIRRAQPEPRIRRARVSTGSGRQALLDSIGGADAEACDQPYSKSLELSSIGKPCGVRSAARCHAS